MSLTQKEKIDLASLKRVGAFDSRVPRFGNSVFFEMFGNNPNVRFNNMYNMLDHKAFWSVTIWFEDIVRDLKWTLEWVINFPCMYRDITPFASAVVGSHLDTKCKHLNRDDLSGKTWKASVLIRRLSNKDIFMLKYNGVEFISEAGVDETVDVNMHYVEDDSPELMLSDELPCYREATKNSYVPCKRSTVLSRRRVRSHK